MAGAISRSQFLRGDFKNQHAPIRPPWSLEEYLFTEICTQCSACISACPEKIIRVGSGHYPVIDFSKGECTFCFKCVDSCEPKALLGSIESKPWNIKASITKQCLTFNGIHCMSCRDQCEVEAIRFIPKLASPACPAIDPLLCNGCGACFQPCPNQSIELKKLSINKSGMNSHLKETVL